ncbi:MAG: altronate dehydratase [Kiritimatiellae bacterium]|nr:altronate dehydratase [Kiritimatiellia bacterium]MBQ3748784.1 altronate dehydratase [Kiritimatiellia bacterium]MBR0241255.1 altronate dehydratase [Kiritimatiellia bacterium]
MIINPNDNVEIREDGHKYALRDIAEGENVIKYGMPIGHATCAIKKGEHVHVHNVKTNLGEVLEYRYEPDEAAIKGWKTVEPKETFLGYRHPDGRVGIRNDIWVIPLVGCVNRLAERLAQSCGGLALTHPYGCSQMGQDHETTANMLAQFCRHPNAGGVLVVSLGCENNTLESFKGRLGLSPEDQDGAKIGLNIRFVKAQDPGDEYEKGLALIKELDAARPKERVPVSVSELVVGLKCGGSDGFSGLTANPLVGRFSDWLAARGGSTVLTEVPEMFGAETLLMKRCRTRSVFDKCVKMINGFKDYYASHNQVCYENPSPGNKAGGITTLEDKSLGCVQKGGSSPVEDVLLYGESVKAHGLSLMTGPGNDLVASTVLAAAGCHLILFTTGRGTPFGCVVPTMKVATNDALAKKKPNWIDWNAMSNPDVGAFAEKVIAVASGEKAKNEISGAQGIAIFKDGVTL